MSADALARGAENAVLNGTTNIEWVTGDAFDVLAEWGKAGPALRCGRGRPARFRQKPGARGGSAARLHEINRRAMQLVGPGGWLLTASCSFHVQRSQFLEMVARAAAGTGRRFTLQRILGQGIDHPDVITIPRPVT